MNGGLKVARFLTNKYRSTHTIEIKQTVCLSIQRYTDHYVNLSFSKKHVNFFMTN